MSDELPQGWASAQIADVVERVPNIKPEDAPNKDFGYVDISSIDNSSFVITDVKRFEGKDAPSRARRPIRPNDIVFSNVRTYLRNIALVGSDCAAEICSTGFTVLRPNAAVEARYLFRYVLTDAFLARVTPQQTGTHYPATSDRVVMSEQVPLAPLAEQRRIVEKLLGQVDACQQRLEKMPKLLKRFRQSILAAACSGRLTADWREENQDVPAADSLIKDAQFEIAQSEDELPVLPENWKWVALGNYAHCFRGRFSPRPRNDPRYFDGKHPFIQIGNLPREGGLVNSHVQTLNDEGLAVSRKFPKGTVVIAIVGATIGNTGVLAYDMCVTDSIVGLETGDELGNRYVELFLRHKKDDVRQISYSSGGQPNINLAVLNPYPLALPRWPSNRKSCGEWRACSRWPTSWSSGWRRRAGKWPSSRPPSSPAPSPANSSPKIPRTNRQKHCCNKSKQTMNPSPRGTPENSPAIHRRGACARPPESRQGRKKPSLSSEAFFRPSGACVHFDFVPTVETVGGCRSSLTGLRNPCSCVSSVVEIVRRVEGRT